MKGVQIITAEEALEHFKAQKITVQTAKPFRREHEPGRPGASGFNTRTEPLKPDHIVTAVRRTDQAGNVSFAITTIDGRKYEAK